MALVALATLAVAPVARAAGDHRAVRPAGRAAPIGTERLSDERTLTRVAHAVVRAPVHARPSPGSRRVGRLRFLTEDGPFELYPVLEGRRGRDGRTWLRIRLPMRPNGRTGWVREEQLGRPWVVRTALRVDRRTLRATLRDRGRLVWSSAVGVGKPTTPTPAGHFWVRTRLRNLGGGGMYGPYAFGTGAYSSLSEWPGGGVVGIHGTDEPRRIPGRPSHGCVRVPNAAIARLWRLMPVGTPVLIT